MSCESLKVQRADCCRGLLVACTTQIGTSADGSCWRDRGARRKSMFLHRGRLVTKISSATPIGPKGSRESALPSLSSTPRNAGTLPRRCDVESSPSRLLESSAVWPERWSRFWCTGHYTNRLRKTASPSTPVTNSSASVPLDWFRRSSSTRAKLDSASNLISILCSAHLAPVMAL